MEDIRPKVRRDLSGRGTVRVPRRSSPYRRPKQKASIKPQTKSISKPPFQPTGFLDGVVVKAKKPIIKQPVIKHSASAATVASKPKPKAQPVVHHNHHQEKSHLSKQFAQHKQRVHKKTSKPNSKKWLRHFATLAAVLVLVVSGYVGLDVWLTNQQVKKVAATNSRTSNEEGKDESKVEGESIDNYSVSPDLPRVLTIPSQNVKARVLQMGVKTDNQLKAPLNIYDTGWYTGSAKPGQTGAILINGHVSGPTQNGVFKNIKSLKQGDVIKLDNGAKQEFSYKVDKVETVLSEEVDMLKMLQPYKIAGKGLNLITCGGKFNPKTHTYESRTLVYATQVE